MGGKVGSACDAHGYRTFSRGGAGATTGGLIGALVRAGILEHRAKVYDAGLREASILLGVEPKRGQARNIARKLGQCTHIRQE